METVVILITLSLIYLANILIIGLGIKTIINTYWTYYMPINHESHIELDGIVISVKYPGSGPHSTEYVEVEFEYEGQKYKYHFAYRTAGFWHVTELWCQESPRKKPEEMADIMMEITSFPGGVQII